MHTESARGIGGSDEKRRDGAKIDVRPASILAVTLGLTTALVCLSGLTLLVGQIENIRAELGREMSGFRVSRGGK